MRRIYKIIILLLIIGFVAIQFFQPSKNSSNDSSGLITEKEPMPESIRQIISNSCLDCHSNQTRYWWYDKISPASWFVYDHIKDAKDKLNLSEWGEMDVYDRIASLDKMGKEVNRKDMPLKSYTLMHKSARLTDEQVTEFVEWTKTHSEELLKSLSK